MHAELNELQIYFAITVDENRVKPQKTGITESQYSAPAEGIAIMVPTMVNSTVITIKEGEKKKQVKTLTLRMLTLRMFTLSPVKPSQLGLVHDELLAQLVHSRQAI